MTIAIDPTDFRNAMRRWPTGVAIVTARMPDGRAEGMTVNSLASISLDPASMMVSLTKGSRTFNAVKETGRFGISILGSGSEDLWRAFARSREARDFTGFTNLVDVPLADEATVRLVCRVIETFPVADHVIVVGRVELLELGNEADPLVLFEEWT